MPEWFLFLGFLTVVTYFGWIELLGPAIKFWKYHTTWAGCLIHKEELNPCWKHRNPIFYLSLTFWDSDQAHWYLRQAESFGDFNWRGA